MSIVIAFISPFPEKTSSLKEEKYKIPDDPTNPISGRQTNEAPIKYLLQRDSSIQKIICICTKAAKEKKKYDNFPQEVSAYGYLEDQLKKVSPAECVPVDFEGDNFEQEVIPKILELVQRNDKIYLETTGGLRNAVSQLILLAQVLEYQKQKSQETRLLGAVYSNYQTKCIEDVTNDYRVFDLITALNEFQHLGGTALLEEYYKGSDLTVTSLIDAMKKLSECIVLCRTQKEGLLEGCIKNFQKALSEAKNANDPMFRVLLPIFEEKFSFPNSVPDIVRWCLENNLILQALTIYNDCIPEYIIEQKKILKVPDNLLLDPKPKNPNSGTKSPNSGHKNRYVYALTDTKNGFFSLGHKIHDSNNDNNEWKAILNLPENAEEDADKFDPGVWLAHNLNNPSFEQLDSLVQDGKTFNGFHVNILRKDMRNLCINYMYINLLRNYLCHDGGEMSSQVSRRYYLTGRCSKPKFDNITVQRVRTVMRDALNQLEKCAATANKGTSHS
jgi:hypothetical protein